MNIATDILFGVLPAFALVGFMSVALMYWAAFRAAHRPRKRAFLIEYFYWLTDPIINLLVAMGVTPNMVTGSSLIFSIGAAIAASQGLFFTTLFIMLIGASCDVFDGQVARRSNAQSQSGAFLDSFMDRLSEGALFAGIAWFGGGGLLSLIAFLAMVSSFSVSYARARGESLGVVANFGIMQRPTRMVMMLFLLLFAGTATALEFVTITPEVLLSVGIGILAVLSAGTAVHRVRFIMKALSQPVRPPIELHSPPPTKSAA
ncbi:MAG: CDP-alcohol phosphatidyltransferase family protein [bacterium]